MANIQAERAVIGSVLIANQEYHTVAPMLRIEMFTSETRQMIWRAIEKMSDEDLPIDAVDVSRFCEIKSGGEYDIDGELMACLEVVPHGAHAKHYAEIVAGIRE